MKRLSIAASLFYFAFGFALFSLTVSAQQITITSPAAGEKWTVGSYRTITWTSSGYDGKKLAITTNSGAYDIADEVPVSNGEYSFSIPWEIPPAEDFTIALKIGGTEKTSVKLELAENTSPNLQIRSPMGNEKWAVENKYAVSWESHNLDGKLKIELLKADAVVDEVSDIDVSSVRYSYEVPKTADPGTDYSIRITSISDESIQLKSRTFSVTATAPAKKKWTVLFYFDGDCTLGLEFDVIDGFYSMSKLGSSELDMNYIFQIDRVPGYDTRFGNWYGTKRFYLLQGMEPTPENAIQDLGELNVAGKETLSDFINWGIENYPAERYFLILADHGSGWYKTGVRTASRPKGDVCDDSTNGGQKLSTKALQQALDAAEAGKITVLGFDTCLEGYIEVAYQVRNSGPDIMIGSQYKESTSVTYDSASWPYLPIFSKLNNQTDMSNEALGALVCNEFIRKFDVQSQTDTLSVTKLSKLDALTEKIASFADAMIADFEDKDAVKTKAEEVKKATRDAVTYFASTVELNGKVNGLNINFPTNKSSIYYKDYTEEYIAFPTPSHWKDFLTAYIDKMKGSWIEDARNASFGGSFDDSADLYNFCNYLSPDKNDVKLNMISQGKGFVAPSNVTLQPRNKNIQIVADPIRDPQQPPLSHFVRWFTSGDVEILDIYSAKTYVKLSGDASILGVFYEDKDKYTVNFTAEGNGTLTGTLTQEVDSGGSCTAVTAVPDEGEAFLGWGGDYDGYENPLILANVQMDMNLLAFFGPVNQVGSKKFKFSFCNAKNNMDKITLADAEYPKNAPQDIESAKLTINGAAFDCPAGTGWSNKKPGIYEFNSAKGSLPQTHLKIDLNKLLWSFSASKANVTSTIIPQNNIEILLLVNGQDAAKISLGFADDLIFKGSCEYKK